MGILKLLVLAAALSLTGCASLGGFAGHPLPPPPPEPPAMARPALLTHSQADGWVEVPWDGPAPQGAYLAVPVADFAAIAEHARLLAEHVRQMREHPAFRK